MSGDGAMDAASGLRFVEAMEDAVRSGDAAAVARHLAPDVSYAVGARPPVRGVEAVMAAIAAQGNVVRWEGHTLRDAWARGDALVVEVTSHFTRVADGRPIPLPCVDVYRFRDGLIADWRVYADMAPFGAP